LQESCEEGYAQEELATRVRMAMHRRSVVRRRRRRDISSGRSHEAEYGIVQHVSRMGASCVMQGRCVRRAEEGMRALSLGGEMAT